MCGPGQRRSHSMSVAARLVPPPPPPSHRRAQFRRPLRTATAAGILDLDIGKIYDLQRRQRTTIWHRF